MSQQYQKTMADLWIETPPRRAQAANSINASVLDDFLRHMPTAAPLDARGVERLLSAPRRGSDDALPPEHLVTNSAAMRGWPATMFPRPMPPFPVTFVETGAPAGRRHGTMFRAHREGADTLLVCLSLARYAGGWETGRSMMLRLGEDHEILAREQVVPTTHWPEPTQPDETLAAGLLAISLTHCRNVVLSENHPPPALSRRHAERHGRPLLRCYTLDIEPMRKVLRAEGRMDETGIRQALHLCRGHFKDYREGGGLFGKHKGLYWWESNVRGAAAQGVVAKDYRIK